MHTFDFIAVSIRLEKLPARCFRDLDIRGPTVSSNKPQAGADASFVEAPRDDDELIEIGKRTTGLRVCNMLEGGVTPLHTAEELKDMGFHLIVHPLTTLYASARALMDIAKELKAKGTTRHKLDGLATFQEFNELVGLESWFELEAKYSPAKSFVSSK